MHKQEEFNIKVDRAKIVSLLTALQMRKLTLEQALELEALMVIERRRAIQNGINDLDIIFMILFDRPKWICRWGLLSRLLK